MLFVCLICSQMAIWSASEASIVLVYFTGLIPSTYKIFRYYPLPDRANVLIIYHQYTYIHTLLLHVDGVVLRGQFHKPINYWCFIFGW